MYKDIVLPVHCMYIILFRSRNWSPTEEVVLQDEVDNHALPVY